MDVIIVLMIWFGLGLLADMGIWIRDMRGKTFDEHYFDDGLIFISFGLAILGPIALLSVIILFFAERKLFTKLIYKIANIGIKKKEENLDKTSV